MFARVAVDDVDIFHRYTELLGDQLGEGRFVPLAMAVRAGEDADLAAGMDAYLAAFPEANCRSQRTGDLGRGGSAGFDTAGDADANQPALAARLRLFLTQLLVIGNLFQLVEEPLIVAAVIQERHRRLVGEIVRRE